MNLRTLRYFVAIADAGSLTAAAAAISIAQPALTRQLRELEAEFGVPLFHRMPRGVRLTQAGVTLYEAAQRILGEAQRVRQRLASKASDTKTTVVLGVSPTLARVLLPGLFEYCLRTLPEVELRSREAFTPELLDWLERGIIDMAVVTNPGVGRSVSLQPLLGEPFALVSHVSMGMGPIVSVAQLARIPLLMTSLHRDIVERQLLPLGKTLNVQAVLDSVDSIRALVQKGPWATIMPVSVFKEVGPSAEIVMSQVTGIQLNRLLVLATRLEPEGKLAIPVVQEMIEAEFSRLMREGMFTFTAAPTPQEPAPAPPATRARRKPPLKRG
jgi:LysR family nitrogen assimilation transcriptional regulator